MQDLLNGSRGSDEAKSQIDVEDFGIPVSAASAATPVSKSYNTAAVETHAFTRVA